MAPSSDEKDGRQHQVVWEDPAPGRRYLLERGGKNYLLALSRGDVAPPPAARLIGYVPHSIEEGRVVFRLDIAEHHLNPFGSVHGGITATLLDAAMTGTVMSTLPAGTGCSTIELKVNYTRSIDRSVGTVFSEGRTLHSGRRIVTAEGRLRDADGQLYAHGVCTCMVLS